MFFLPTYLNKKRKKKARKMNLPNYFGARIRVPLTLKGTKRQQSGQWVKIFKTETALEIHHARLAEAYGKVYGEKNG